MLKQQVTPTRESWKSRAGFVFAAVGSAVGLINIWRFPYIVVENGGSAFIIIYLLFLLVIGFPVLLSEVVIGRTSQRSPARAMEVITSKKGWSSVGKGIIATGFIVSSFYSVVAGWIVGYLVEALTGGFSGITLSEATTLFDIRTASAGWSIGYQAVFLFLSAFILVRGVRGGIERANKFLMPLLLIILIALVVRGFFFAGGSRALDYLFSPDWSAITPMVILTALGHAFFTLSLGQGTMITYGSYLRGRDSISRTCGPVVGFDTIVSLLAAMAVISILVASGNELSSGPGLLFSTLPTAFSELPGGVAISVAFFLLVLFAALTSQTSAMEPTISYLITEKGWTRTKAVILVTTGAFALGIPSALSFGVLRHVQVYGYTFFDVISGFTMDILLPVGGLVAVLFVGWFWGFNKAYAELGKGHTKHGPYYWYLNVCVRYVAPVAIVITLFANIIW